jgi:hypothetical protein
VSLHASAAIGVLVESTTIRDALERVRAQDLPR